MGALEISFASPKFTVAHWGPLLVNVWYREATAADLDIVGPHERELVKAHPGGISVLTVLKQVNLTAPPGDDLRQAAARLTVEFAPYLRCNATVLQADGLVGSVARTFITGINLLAKNQAPTKVFKEIGDAVAWIAALPKQPTSLATEQRAITEALEQRFP